MIKHSIPFRSREVSSRIHCIRIFGDGTETGVYFYVPYLARESFRRLKLNRIIFDRSR